MSVTRLQVIYHFNGLAAVIAGLRWAGIERGSDGERRPFFEKGESVTEINVPWCKVNMRGNIICERCGRKIDPQWPMYLDDFVDVLKFFIQTHKDCEEKKERTES